MYTCWASSSRLERAGRIALGLPHSGHRDPPAIRVLRQPEVLAEFLAAQQEIGGGWQVVALAGDLTHPDVHVGRSAQHGSGFARTRAARPCS